jgi:hypothetical protein
MTAAFRKTLAADKGDTHSDGGPADQPTEPLSADRAPAALARGGGMPPVALAESVRKLR